MDAMSLALMCCIKKGWKWYHAVEIARVLLSNWIGKSGPMLKPILLVLLLLTLLILLTLLLLLSIQLLLLSLLLPICTTFGPMFKPILHLESAGIVHLNWLCPVLSDITLLEFRYKMQYNQASASSSTKKYFWYAIIKVISSLHLV